MPEETDTTTLSSPLSFPLSQKQALSVVAAQCATEVTASVATKLVGVPPGWDDQLLRFQKRMQEAIYVFLTDPTPTPPTP